LIGTQWQQLLMTRTTRPVAIAEAYARRAQPDNLLNERGTMFLVAADHPARGALRAGADSMANRRTLLDHLSPLSPTRTWMGDLVTSSGAIVSFG